MESSSTISPAVGRAVDAPTVTEALRRTAANHPEIVAVRTTDDSVSLTWSELLRRVEAVAGGLAKLGRRPRRHGRDHARQPPRVPHRRPGGGDARRDAVLDLPDVSARRDRVPDRRRRVEGGDRRAGPRRRAARGAQRPPRARARDRGRRRRPRNTISLADVEGSNPDFDAAAGEAEIGPDDFVTLIYTSGTTGPPKGVQLSHRNIMAGAQAVEQVIPFDPGAKVISWLPAAHIAERMAHHYIPVVYAGTITCCPNPREVLSYLPQVRPTWFFAVPRIWEKLKAGLETMQAAQPEEQRRPIQDALAASLERVRLRQRGRARARGARGEGRPGRRADVLQAPRDARARPGASRSTSAPRRHPSRCSSSSTRSGSSWGSCGACPRRAASAPATGPGRSGSGRSARPSPASRSRSPTTGSCSSAATA